MSWHKMTLLALLALAVSISGCCCITDRTVEIASVRPSVSTVTVDGDIVGAWSSEGPYGTLYDPATGGAAGSVYNGEWYIFRNDGTYRYVIMSSGTVISGGVVREGKYNIDGGEISLYDNEESWYPDASRSDQTPAYKNKPADDERQSYEVQDADTIFIDGHTFYRISQQ